MANEHFISAARKHYNDAAVLHADGRHDNCAYLSGYVVECALKAMVEASSTFNPRQFGHNLATLSTRAVTLAAVLSPARQDVTLPCSQDYTDLLAQWKAEERYHAEGDMDHERSVSRLRAARETLEAIVIPMVLDNRN